ncbi:hypothetical protein LTR15_003770 [Elasticomyces elasticus]|nr:hypothetical protein LTR15_003770 [Elasticomyces elasticus]
MMPNDAESQVTETIDAQVSARTRVFGTTELLEQILTNTQGRDVLLAQRASQRWQAVIKSSLHLQRMLYDTPCEMIDPVQWAADILPPPATRNPWFLQDNGILCNRPINPNALYWTWTTFQRNEVCLYVDEQLAKFIGLGGRGSSHDGDGSPVRRRNISLHLDTEKLSESAGRPEASWRSMIIQTPGVEGDVVVTGLTGINISVRVHNEILSAAKSNERDGFVRLGKLWDAAVEAHNEMQREMVRDQMDAGWGY